MFASKMLRMLQADYVPMAVGQKWSSEEYSSL